MLITQLLFRKSKTFINLFDTVMAVGVSHSLTRLVKKTLQTKSRSPILTTSSHTRIQNTDNLVFFILLHTKERLLRHN